MKIKKVIISLGAAGLLSGFVGNYFYTQEQVNKFQSDLEVLGVEKNKALGISEYFRGLKNYLTVEERDEWIRIVNELKKRKGILKLGSVKSKKDFIKKANLLISEEAEKLKNQ